MLGQGRSKRQDGAVPDGVGPVWLVVPVVVLERLREGLFAELGGAGEALHAVASSGEDRESVRECLGLAMDRARGAWELLATAEDSSVGARVDLAAYGAPLGRALGLALVFAEDDLEESERAGGGASDRKLGEGVAALREFAGMARERIDQLAREDGGERR
jgi:hypothetical protein